MAEYGAGLYGAGLYGTGSSFVITAAMLAAFPEARILAWETNPPAGDIPLPAAPLLGGFPERWPR